MIRDYLYAGTWYPELKSEIEKFIEPGAKKVRAIAGICPHAGWVYSGKVAGLVYSRMQPAALYILIGPNHRGLGAPASVFADGSWQTPLGDLTVDRDAADSLLKKSPYLSSDLLAHSQEHSLEVQAPFIKYFAPDASIVPISLYDYRPEVCRSLGHAIAGMLKESGRAGKTVLIASTDMSHYISSASAKKQDKLAIDRILALDPDGLLSVVTEKDISMCGSGPAAAVLWAAKELGANSAELVKYATSGDVTGDNDEVVGYAGMIIS